MLNNNKKSMYFQLKKDKKRRPLFRLLLWLDVWFLHCWGHLGGRSKDGGVWCDACTRAGRMAFRVVYLAVKHFLENPPKMHMLCVHLSSPETIRKAKSTWRGFCWAPARDCTPPAESTCQLSRIVMWWTHYTDSTTMAFWNLQFQNDQHSLVQSVFTCLPGGHFGDKCYVGVVFIVMY